MCTVTYIPQPGGDFILTSNRDENAARSPQNLTHGVHSGVEMIFPQDVVAGGTWIAASADNRVVCLLNGAFEKHLHQPPYKRSRGVMALEFFSFNSAPAFFEQYDFEGMEPFTFLMVDNGQPYELRWDGKDTHPLQLDRNGYYIWSSATLYPAEVRAEREGWFNAWLQGRVDFGLDAIYQFHRNGGKGDTWNGFVMNRNNLVQTVSISSLVKEKNAITLIYNDLLRGKIKKESIMLKEATIA